MNFLQLVQRVRSESGLQGTGPASVVAQSGESLKLVEWTRTAWREVQMARPSWRWMRASASTTTVQSVGDYSTDDFALTRFGRWDRESFRLYSQTVADMQFLAFMDYACFRDRYRFGVQTQGRPTVFTVGPNDKIMLAPVPDAAYVLTAEYFKSPQNLEGNDDIPECPAQHHMIIVWAALMRYATYDAAAEVYDAAKNRYLAEMAWLERDQLDPITGIAEPLV